MVACVRERQRRNNGCPTHFKRGDPKHRVRRLPPRRPPPTHQHGRRHGMVVPRFSGRPSRLLLQTQDKKTRTQTRVQARRGKHGRLQRILQVDSRRPPNSAKSACTSKPAQRSAASSREPHPSHPSPKQACPAGSCTRPCQLHPTPNNSRHSLLAHATSVSHACPPLKQPPAQPLLPS